MTKNNKQILGTSKCSEEESIADILSELTCDEGFENNLYLYNSNTLVLNEEIGSKITEKFALPLIEMLNDDNCPEINIFVNSVGGSVLDSFYICNLIDQAEKPVYINILGYAFSAAGMIAMAGKNNPYVVRRCYPFSFFLFHSGSTTLQGRLQDVDSAYQLQKTIEKMYKNYILEHSNLTSKQYDKLYVNDSYFDSQTMYELGLVDEIIGVTPKITVDEDDFAEDLED